MFHAARKLSIKGFNTSIRLLKMLRKHFLKFLSFYFCKDKTWLPFILQRFFCLISSALGEIEHRQLSRTLLLWHSWTGGSLNTFKPVLHLDSQSEARDASAACLPSRQNCKAPSDSACFSGPQGLSRSENIRRFRLWGPVGQLQATAMFVYGTILPETKTLPGVTTALQLVLILFFHS